MASADRYAAPAGNSAPPVGSRYASPSAVPPTAGSGSYNTPPAASYPPVNTSGSSGFVPANPSNPASTNPNNTAPDANRYAPPGGFSVPPASGASDPPAYRPGSTSDYVPRRAGATSLGAISSMPTTTSSVTPVSYTQPAAGTGM